MIYVKLFNDDNFPVLLDEFDLLEISEQIYANLMGWTN